MNFIEAALTALRKADSPLDFRELWSLVVELGLDKQLASTGKTPWNTMGARVYIEVRDNPDAEIVALGERPKRFWLKSRALPGAKSAPAVSAPAVAPGKSAVQKSKPIFIPCLLTSRDTRWARSPCPDDPAPGQRQGAIR